MDKRANNSQAKLIMQMETNALNFLFLPCKTPPPPSSIAIPANHFSFGQKTESKIFLPRSRRHSLRLGSINVTENDGTPQPVVPPTTITPPDGVEIRFRRRSRKRNRQRREDGTVGGQGVQERVRDAPKKWEDMNLSEKATELYMGEKGLLFWLNKFAYASIFIVIGSWIVFRFVGPALNLYQLDAPPLPPSSMFKDS